MVGLAVAYFELLITGENMAVNMKYILTLAVVFGFGLVCASPALSVESPGTRTITAQEKAFLGPALSYLDEANSLGKKVALAMNGANDGSSTLGDIRDAIKRAKFVENASYRGDYLDKIKGSTPASFANEQQQIAETHQLFQAAMKEYLEYWKDSNPAHIASGSATFKRCVATMNSAIQATNAKMKNLAPK